MKPEAQRIAIAEACGWKWYRVGADGTEEGKFRRSLLLHDCAGFFKPADMTERMVNPTWMWREGQVPNYLNDLNAMHEAEKVLDYETTTFRTGSFNLYRDTLQRMTGGENWGRATAAQRAEALLRAIDKWEDEK